MRYKFYREHKYVSFRFNELERLVARADFKRDEELNKVIDRTSAFQKRSDLN